MQMRLHAVKIGVLAFFILTLNHGYLSGAEEQGSLYNSLRNQSEKVVAQTVRLVDEPLGNFAVFFKAVDSETTKPILEYDVRYVKASGGWSQHGALVRPDGICSIAHLRNTVYNFEFFSPGYEAAQKQIDIATLSGRLKVDFNSRDSEKIKEVLDPDKTITSEPIIVQLIPAKGRVRGQVIDAIAHKPVETVVISVSEQKDVIGKEVTLATDSQGVFLAEKLRQLPKEEKTLLSFKKKGYVPYTVELLRDNWQEDLGQVKLMPKGGIGGVLVDAEGRPVKAAEVFLGTVAEFENLESGRKYVPPMRMVTDQEGNFSFEDIESGEYKILYGPAGNDFLKITIKPGEEVTMTFQRSSKI